MITLDAALEITRRAVFGESQETFSIEYLDCDRDKKTGGNLIQIARAQKHGLKNLAGYKYMIGIYDHETGRRKAVHERLIFKINGQEVYW